MNPRMLVMAVMVLILEYWLCYGCWDQERVALLKLKPVFRYIPAANSSSNCCAWEGVKCNATTGRVVAISIRSPWRYYYLNFSVDASLFLPFEELQSLDLSGNGIMNWFDSTEDCEKIRGNDSDLHDHSPRLSKWNTAILNRTCSKRVSKKFSKLEFLDLSSNFLYDNSVPSLAAFPSLKSLNLAGNFIGKSLQTGNLPNVEKLEFLNLNYLHLRSDSLETIGVMKSLRNLSLHGCKLQGTLTSFQGLCKLLHLEELDISENHLTETLPWCLTNMTFLKKLDISFNDFSGDLSLSPLRNLKSIELINISNNHFQIPISFNPFFNHSKLKYFEAQNNKIHDDRKTNPSPPMFQLLTLNLVFSKGYAASFPEFLYYQHDLLQLDISNVKMIEGSQYWLVKNNTRLKRLVLVNCSLSGPLQLPPNHHDHLSYLDISENRFNGPIPGDIGTLFPELTFLNMSGNSFEGGIPAPIGDMNSLLALDLSNNRLSGGVPQTLASGCFSLRTLVLSNNILQGKILPPHSNLRNLSQLWLDRNFFIGEIPNSLRNSSKLEVLDISDNQLSGGIPDWMGELSYLEILELSHNSLNGTLPFDFNPLMLSHVHLTRNRLRGHLMNAFANCSSLVTLDLSHNELSGEISSWFRTLYGSLKYLLLNNNEFEGEIPINFICLLALSLIDLSQNNLSGEIFPCLLDHQCLESVADCPVYARAMVPPYPQEPLQFTTKNNTYQYGGKILEYMTGIDLSCNKFTGEIPEGIWILSKLHSFNLSHNSLTGEIPTTISSLTEIESLDLSYNSLSGEIPSEITSLYRLSVFSVAYNNLSGKTPDEVAQFGTFDNDSYKGNPFLCGLPLSKRCNATPSPIPFPAAYIYEENNDSIIDFSVFWITFWVTYICVLLGMAAVMIINPRWRRNWICFVEMSTCTCYYFVVDNISKIFKPRIMYTCCFIC